MSPTKSKLLSTFYFRWVDSSLESHEEFIGVYQVVLSDCGFISSCYYTGCSVKGECVHH